MRLVELLRQFLVQDFVDKRAFAAAGHAGYAHKHPQRYLNVDVFEIVLVRAAYDDAAAAAFATALRQRYLAPAAQILPGNALRRADDVFHRPACDDMPAVFARSGPQVNDVVGGAHNRLVVFYDKHGVAQIAQPLERLDEAVVVRGMQSDGRLVAHVQHAHKSRSDLRRQADALRLAAAERGRHSGQREVVQPDVEQEVQPRLYLFQDLACDRLFAVGERARRRLRHRRCAIAPALALAPGCARLAPVARLRQRRPGIRQRLGDLRCLIPPDSGDPFARLRYGLVGRLHNVQAANGYGARLRPQALPLAGFASAGRHVSLYLGAHMLRFGLFVAARQIVDDALKRGAPAVCLAALRVVANVNRLALCAVHHQIQVALAHLAHGFVHRKVVGARQRFQLTGVPRTHSA